MKLLFSSCHGFTKILFDKSLNGNRHKLKRFKDDYRNEMVTLLCYPHVLFQARVHDVT